MFAYVIRASMERIATPLVALMRGTYSSAAAVRPVRCCCSVSEVLHASRSMHTCKYLCAKHCVKSSKHNLVASAQTHARQLLISLKCRCDDCAKGRRT